MYYDPAIYVEDRQNYDLSKACKPCINHSYTEDGKRQCKLKKLFGNDLSMCGEFRPRPIKPLKAGMTELEALFKDQ